MNYNTQVKSKQLGINFSTATNRLKKNIMFALIVECGRDTCFRCNNKISTPDELSVDHIEAWLHSDNPQGLFFSLDNISFSHLSCNSAAARQPRAKRGL